MDAESVKPPGYFMMRRQLVFSGVYCRQYAPREAEYWYRSDGSPTGVKTDQGRPTDAAFATTPEIAAACAGLKDGAGVCALNIGAAKACRTPEDEDHRALCRMMLGDDATGDTRDYTMMKELPPLVVTLDGARYRLPGKCTDVLRQLDEASGNAPGPAAAATMRTNCPDFLAALERRLGSGPAQAAFWPALNDLVQANFPPASARVAPTTSIARDPNFQRMCVQATAFEKQCRLNQNKMGAVGTKSFSSDLQAGDFNDCADVYGGVRRMCERAYKAAGLPPLKSDSKAAPTVAAAQPATPAPTASISPPASASGQSGVRPTAPAAPPALTAMSAACQAQVKKLFEGADTGDDAKAAAAYSALRTSDCDRQTRDLAQAANTGLPERRMTSRGSEIMSRAMNNDRGTIEATIGDRKYAPNGSGYEMAEILDFAITLFGFAANVAATANAFYVPAPSGNFTTMNRPVRGTYGQGAPAYSAPRQPSSTITGGR